MLKKKLMQNLFFLAPTAPKGQKRQNNQKLGKYVPKIELLVGYFQDSS